MVTVVAGAAEIDAALVCMDPHQGGIVGMIFVVWEVWRTVGGGELSVAAEKLRV